MIFKLVRNVRKFFKQKKGGLAEGQVWNLAGDQRPGGHQVANDQVEKHFLKIHFEAGAPSRLEKGTAFETLVAPSSSDRSRSSIRRSSTLESHRMEFVSMQWPGGILLLSQLAAVPPPTPST